MILVSSIQIMKNIGVLRTELKALSVREYVSLYIEQTYTRKHPRRDKAIKTIQEVCKGLHSNIDEAAKKYNNL